MLSEYFHVQLRQWVNVLLPLNHVVEVTTLTVREICPIPGIPSTLLGVANQRGKLLWVLELSDLIIPGTAPKRLLNQDKLTIVVLTASANSSTGQTERQLGCVVSTLKGIVTLDGEKLKPVSAAPTPTWHSFLSGVAEIEQSHIAVLDINAVFSSVSTSNFSLAPL